MGAVITTLSPQDLPTPGLVIVTLILTYYIYTRSNGKQNYPDGPPTIPILGNIPQLLMSKDMSMIHFLEDNRRKYGNAYTIELGGIKRVVVSGYTIIQELLVKNADLSSNRTTLAMPANDTEIAKTTPGLFWAKHPHWKTIRSFALNTLREEGMGKSSLEPQIMHEIHAYIDNFIAPHIGQPINLSDSIMMATANVMSSMIHGHRKDYTDTTFLLWMKHFGLSLKAVVKASVVRNIPFAQYLPGDASGVKANKDAGNILLPEAMKEVEACKDSLDPNHLTSYVDKFVYHSQKERAAGRSDNIFTDGNAAMTMMHLYGAGTETTSTALRWAILYMCAYPDMQVKVHEEIDSALGANEVRYADRSALPYTEAVILEVLRLGNIAPTGLPHTLEEEYTLPAGCELMINMASILWDEKVFEEPEKFKPERYLSGDVTLKKSRTIAFGIGEGLARMELSLFFTTFMQKFKVSLPAGHVPNLNGVCSIVNAPADYQVIFTER
ncbi:hypothetical protein EB796_019732 [Bugula neritina]|uniref:Uncharacterized protein n=1 Tax=Bugula neritina TaxID=10212 RepID=A0A7J7J8Q8_BUGNE|nr:hypothetical protein EB796_019732 [Bugula neritina]